MQTVSNTVIQTHTHVTETGADTVTDTDLATSHRHSE